MKKDTTFKTDMNLEFPIAGLIFSILTLGIAFVLFYEFFYEPHYSYNQKKFYRLLRWNRVKMISAGRLEEIGRDDITAYVIEINGKEYSVWIYGETHVTLSDTTKYSDYIGLFCVSPYLKWIRKKTIKKLIALEKELEYEEFL